MRYGAGIKRARLQAGWSQKKLAKIMGIEASYISLIEADKRVPSLEVLERIAQECSLRLSHLVQLCETMDNASR